MINAIKILLSAVLCAFCLCGCVIANFWDWDSIEGKGEHKNYDIETGAFSGIKVEGFCEVRYSASPSISVSLKVQPNLREYITVKVIKGDLVINTTKKIKFSSDINRPVLTVSAPLLERLEIGGAGKFTAYNKITVDSFAFIINGAGSGEAELDVRKLDVDLSGAGSLRLSGAADAALFAMSGAGELDASSLATREAEVKFSGAGSVRVNCSSLLTIDADGVGSVEYRGSPEIRMNKDGLVSIKKIN
jgi:hypothetical protein